MRSQLLFLFLMALVAPASSFAQYLDNQEFMWQQISSPLPKPTVLEITPKGLIVGEYNTIYNTERYNGLVLSKDLGQTWNRIGPEKRAINDISYEKGNFTKIGKHKVGKKGADITKYYTTLISVVD